MKPDRDRPQSVFSALRWSASARLITQVITWTSTIIVARLLSPDDYGLAALAGLFVGYFLMLSDFGLGTALVQSQTVSAQETSSVDSALLIAGMSISLLMAIAAPLIASAFGDARIVDLVRALAIQPVLVASAAVPSALLVKAMRFDTLARYSVISGVAAAGVTLLCALRGLGAWSLVAGWTAESLVRAILLRGQQGTLRLARPKWKVLRKFVGFSKWIIAEKSLWYWYAQSDTAIVGRVLGIQALGYFTIAKQVAMMPADKIMPILNQIALPAFSRIQDESTQFSQSALKLIRIGAVCAVPIFWGLSAIAPALLPALLGRKWQAAGPIMAVICLAMPFRMISSMIVPAVTAMGRPDISFKNMVFAIIIVPAAMLAGSTFGMIGVAAGWALSVPVVAAVFFIRSAPIIGLKLASIAGAVRVPFLAALGMYLVVLAATSSTVESLGPLLGLSVAILIGVSSYAALLALIDRKLLIECLQFTKAVVTS
jgi:teichuronic acid exporter